MSDRGPIALVDGYNMAFRAFYGMPELTRTDGFPTGAIHGWVKTLWYLEDHYQPRDLLVFFDLGGPQRHIALLEDYKANRSDTPPALEQQVPVIKSVTLAMGYGGIEKDGVEADDLIAAYACQLRERGEDNIVIVSADKDLGQLVGDGITQLVPPPTANPKLGWRHLDADGVEQKFGIPPAKVADYLAIIGDTSDNIPGLKGVGPKTAVKWLQQYGDIETIINHCGELMPRRFQALVHAEAEKLRLYRQLTTLDLDHDVPEVWSTEADRDEVTRLLTEMEMGKTVEAWQKRTAG